MKLEIITQEQRKAHIQTQFVLITTLASLQSEKDRRYLDYWLDWEPIFYQIQLPVWILTEDTHSHIKAFYENYPTSLHVGCCRNLSTFQTLQCIRSKSVFGKTCNVVDPIICLFYQDQMIYKAVRTNEKTIGEAYLQGLDIQYKKFVINFRKKLTDQKEFVSIRKR